MELGKVLEVVPIRKPMLCIDEISEVEYGKSVKGYRNISKDEPWAEGHFLGEPVFPGTLIIETMAQIGAFIFYNEEDPQELKSYFAKVNNVKFLKKVVPDCRLYINSEFVSKAGQLVQIRCKATVNNEVVAKGELTLYFIKDFTL